MICSAWGLPVPAPPWGQGRPARTEGHQPLLANSGAWRVSGGRLLRVVSAVAPGEELCKYLHRTGWWEQSLTVALGSGEGGCGPEEDQRGCVYV